MACKGNRKDLQMTKQYIAMRALRVRIGSFFWADKSFSLKILSTILSLHSQRHIYIYKLKSGKHVANKSIK